WQMLNATTNARSLWALRGDVVRHHHIRISLITTLVKISQEDGHLLQQRGRAMPRQLGRVREAGIGNRTDKQALLGDWQLTHVLGEAAEYSVLKQILLHVRSVERSHGQTAL